MDYEMEFINPYVINAGSGNDLIVLSKYNMTCHPERITRWFEFEMITWGDEKSFILTDGEKTPCQAGTIFFRPPGTRIQGFYDYHYYDILFDLYFDPSRSEEYAKPFDEHFFRESCHIRKPIQHAIPEIFAQPVIYHTNRYQVLNDLCKSMYNIFMYKKKDFHLILKSKALQLLVHIYQEISEKHLNTRQNELEQHDSLPESYIKILEVKNFVQENYMSEYSIDYLADLAGLSRGFFGRSFKKIVGDSPVDFINKVRILAAKNLILFSNNKISEIAAECGFSNERYFFTVFKKIVGMSPSEFKETTEQQMIIHDEIK